MGAHRTRKTEEFYQFNEQFFSGNSNPDFNVSEKTTRFWGKISRYDAIKIRLIPETRFRGCDQFPEIIR